MEYVKNEWNVGDVITKQKLDNLEDGMYNLSHKELLWTNENPTTSVGTHNIEIDTSNYTKIIMEFVTVESSGAKTTQHFEIDKNMGYTDGEYYQTIAQYCQFMRWIDVHTDKIEVSDSQSYIDWTTSNNILIPYKVYGVK